MVKNIELIFVFQLFIKTKKIKHILLNVMDMSSIRKQKSKQKEIIIEQEIFKKRVMKLLDLVELKYGIDHINVLMKF